VSWSGSGAAAPSLRAMSSRRKTALAARRHGAGSGRQNAHDMERTSAMVTDAVMCKTAWPSTNGRPDLLTTAADELYTQLHRAAAAATNTETTGP